MNGLARSQRSAVRGRTKRKEKLAGAEGTLLMQSRNEGHAESLWFLCILGLVSAGWRLKFVRYLN